MAPQVGWNFAKTGVEFKGDAAFVALGTPVTTDSLTNHIVSSKCYLWTGAGAAFKGLKYAPGGVNGGLYDPGSTPICERVGTATTTTAAPATTTAAPTTTTTTPAAPKEGSSCDASTWFIDGASYSQSVLCDKGGCGMTQAAIEDACLAKDKGSGVFYQRHDPLGHVICGVYNNAPPSTGHQQKQNGKLGAVCLPA